MVAKNTIDRCFKAAEELKFVFLVDHSSNYAWLIDGEARQKLLDFHLLLQRFGVVHSQTSVDWLAAANSHKFVLKVSHVQNSIHI